MTSPGGHWVNASRHGNWRRCSRLAEGVAEGGMVVFAGVFGWVGPLGRDEEWAQTFGGDCGGAIE